MISSNNVDPPHGATVQMVPAEFRVIFQVTKEAHSIPSAVLDRLNWDNADVTRIVDTARLINVLAGEAELVRIDLGQDIELGTDLMAPVVMDVRAGDVTVRAVVVKLPGHLGRAWYELVESVIDSLGERELFLRTGYSSDEIRVAASRIYVGDSGPAK